MINIKDLNPEQQAAATYRSGPLMVLAGAGTGKTRVITYRIAHMLERGIRPQKIAAMTFTNKAALEMRQRIGELAGHTTTKNLFVGTFHSFCLRILRKWPVEAGLGKRFTLLSSSDQLDLVRRALDEKGWSGLYQSNTLLYEIGQCKNGLLTPENMDKNPEKLEKLETDLEALKHIYSLYERQLRLNQAIDFDDCILKVYNLLLREPLVQSEIQQTYKHILVDEFQDTNLAQLSILKQLAPANGDLCAVGDDDQSIYSWRGALFETLEHFENHFKGLKYIKLEQNYRCTNTILNAANHLIKHNKKRKDKTLWSQKNSPEPIRITQCLDPNHESKWVANQCLELHKHQNTPLNQLAVLYRTNSQSKELEMSLRESGLNYKVYGGQSFFMRKEVLDLLAYLRVILDPYHHIAFWRVVNTPPRGIGLKTQEKIHQLAQRYHCSPRKVIQEKSKELDGRASSALSKLEAELCALRPSNPQSPSSLSNLAKKIIEHFALVDYIKETTKDQGSRQRKIQNLNIVPQWLEKAASDYLEENGNLDLSKLMDKITLADQDLGNPKKEQSSHISLMSVHAAKGLEFTNVFLVGLEEGLLPHKNSTSHLNELSEERRLFYVALTRAKERLFLTHCQKRRTGFQTEDRKVSRFVKELPTNETIQKDVGASEQDLNQVKEARKTRTLGRLSELRKSLSH